MKQKAPPPPPDHQLTPEMRKQIEDACARRDLEFLRKSFASNNPRVSEYAERFLEQAVEMLRSERDRNDTNASPTSLQVAASADFS